MRRRSLCLFLVFGRDLFQHINLPSPGRGEMALRQKSPIALRWLWLGLAFCGIQLLRGGRSLATSVPSLLGVVPPPRGKKARAIETPPSEANKVQKMVPAVALPPKTPTESLQERALRERLSRLTLAQLKIRWERLKKICRRQRLPKPTQFAAFGMTGIKLPAHASDLSPLPKSSVFRDYLRRFPHPDVRGSDEALEKLLEDVTRLRAWVQSGDGDRPKFGGLTNLLHYLAFFFDGDGCASSSNKSVSISIGQSIQQTEILALFF